MICRFPTWTSKNWYFFISDVLLNAFIFTPLTIALWVSTWELIYNIVEVVAKEKNLDLAFWIVLVCGSLVVLTIYLIQQPLRPCISPETSAPAFVAVFIRVEMYIIFMARMAVWVSLWDIIGYSKLNTGLVIIIGLIGLCCLRSVNCAVSMPMKLHLDCQQKPCNQATRFMIDANENDGTLKQKCLYVIDAVVTALVIEYLIIALWKGAFNVFDLYILPNDPKFSAWVTVIIGYNMFWLLVICQFPASQISKKLSSSWKQVLWEQVFWLYAFIMMVFLWRGAWNLITAYSGLRTVREPFNFVVSFVMHLVSVLLTLGLNVFVNARIPFFTAPDGDLPEGRGVLVKNYLKHVSNLMSSYISEDDSESTTLLDNNADNKDLKNIADDGADKDPNKTQDADPVHSEPTNQEATSSSGK